MAAVSSEESEWEGEGNETRVSLSRKRGLIHLHAPRDGRRVSILATDAARASSATVVNSEEEDRGKLGWASL